MCIWVITGWGDGCTYGHQTISGIVLSLTIFVNLKTMSCVYTALFRTTTALTEDVKGFSETLSSTRPFINNEQCLSLLTRVKDKIPRKKGASTRSFIENKAHKEVEMSVSGGSIVLEIYLIITSARGCAVSSLPIRQFRDLVSHISASITYRNNKPHRLKQRSLATMGCTPSKPSRPRSRETETTFRPYTGPKQFRGSVMPERKPHFQPVQKHQMDQDQEQQRSNRRAAQETESKFRPYAGPKEFRGSVMPERSPHFQPAPIHQVDQDQEQQRSSRRAAQMYHKYQRQDQQRGIRDGRRYSWEGHPSEKVYTTFAQMADRGVIPKKALKKK